MKLFILMCVFAAIGGVTSYFAKERGRDPLIWFLIGITFGLLGLLALFLMPSYAKSADQKDAKVTVVVPESLPAPAHEYATKDWFYLDDDHKQVGPIVFDRLQNLWEREKLVPTSLVWCEGLPEWQKIENIKSLAGLLPRKTET